MIQLCIHHACTYTLEELGLLWLLILSKTWCHTASRLLVLVLLNNFEDVSSQIHLEFVLCQTLLANTIPKATNFLLCHLPVLRRSLIQLSKLDQKPVIKHLLRIHTDWMLGHDLYRYCVLARYDLRIRSHHVVLDVRGFNFE